ncbi:N-glycosylase/DNA lyase, partial [Candidatus Micrarchaeota archaeon]|nr:N-glycosylase/DNA lyase [Candidatus Micrarchaeota archaeon]
MVVAVARAELASRIRELKKTPAARLISQRMREFERAGARGDWFSELCFCISTANASAQAGLRFEEKSRGRLRSASEAQLRKWLRASGCRFYRNKARFIVQAREKFDSRNLKKKILGFHSARKAREWLVKTVKGLGWKEASHFLRNVGSKNVAIIDRHVLRALHEHGVVDSLKLSPKKYLLIERKLDA